MGKPIKMKHECINNAVRECVLLVQQHLQKDAVGTCVRHFCDFEKSCARMEHRDADPRQHRAHDDGLAQCAVPSLTEGQQNALEKGSRLEQGLFQGHEQMKVESLVLVNVVPHSWKQHKVQKPLAHFHVEVRHKHTRGLIHRRSRPRLWLRDIKHLFPVAQAGDDLKGLGKLSGPIPRENLSDPLVHSDNLWVERRHRLGICELALNLGFLLLDFTHDNVCQGEALWWLGSHKRRQRPLIPRINIQVLVVSVGVFMKPSCCVRFVHLIVGVDMQRSSRPRSCSGCPSRCCPLHFQLLLPCLVQNFLRQCNPNKLLALLLLAQALFLLALLDTLVGLGCLAGQDLVAERSMPLVAPFAFVLHGCVLNRGSNNDRGARCNSRR
eukprot:m.482325 g.482325  ORF g.482325 m.482325 type:complete len:381 (+) comp22494_c0_seq1:240-1382(+)